MTRPEEVTDLEDHQLQSHDFITADAQFLMRDISVGHALLALLEALRNSDQFNLEEDGQIKATVPLNEEEKTRALQRAQTSWDSNQRDYQLADEKRTETWRRYSLDRWADDEGLDRIDWEQHDASHSAEVSR